MGTSKAPLQAAKLNNVEAQLSLRFLQNVNPRVKVNRIFSTVYVFKMNSLLNIFSFDAFMPAKYESF